MYNKKSIIFLISNLLSSFFPFLTIIIYTHLLSAQDYGVYYLTYSSATFIYSITVGTLGLAVLRFWPTATKEHKQTLYTTLYFLTYTALIIISLSMLMFSIFTDTPITYLILFTMIIYISYSLIQFKLMFIRSTYRPYTYGALHIARTGFSLIFGILLYFRYSLYGILAGIFLGHFLACLLLIFERQDKEKLKFQLINKKLIKDLLIYSIPLTLNSTLMYIMSYSDRWLLTFLASIKSAGLYIAAYTLPSQILIAIMMGMHLNLYPKDICAYETGSAKKTKAQLADHWTQLLAIVIPSCIGLIILRNNLITHVLGTSFSATAIGLLPWIILAVFFGGIKIYYVDIALCLAKKTFMQIYICVIIAIINILLNIILIPKFDLYGSIIALIISNFLAFLLSYFLGSQFVQIPLLLWRLWKIVLSTLIMAIVLYYIKNWSGWLYLVLQIIIGISIYCIVFLILNYQAIYGIILKNRSRMTA
ncbi:MAG: polysaccharide biosynthesis C-terminal domain-containing protein [Pseudomonadota bacterium]